MIVAPPEERVSAPFRKIAEAYPEEMDRYLALFSPTDEKGRYLHYDELRFRIPKELDLSLAWSVVKSARERQLKTLIHLGEFDRACGLLLTPTIQKAISQTDRYTTNAALAWILNHLGERDHFETLLNNLVQDEAISSSQLEGAATTTQVAKDLLSRNRAPKTSGERMILGNFKMMTLAWQIRKQALSLDRLLEMHQIGVETIDDEKYRPGMLRDNDEVVVVDAKNNILHRPPPVSGLQTRLKKLIRWANADHQDTEHQDYIHPLVKAIVLHFAIGYEHPFRDGNGRVARSLFYWFMFKNDFAAFRYIAISTLLKAAPVQYGKSYLYTETDEMDLTYFVDYQCRIILRAIATFREVSKLI